MSSWLLKGRLALLCGKASYAHVSPHGPRTQVVDAMRTTISGMLGTLPPQYFDVSVNTSSESLASLMLSVLMTGYLLCNAQCALAPPAHMPSLRIVLSAQWQRTLHLACAHCPDCA